MRKNLLTSAARWGKLSYRKNGDFPGTAVILIHGAVGDSRLFRFQLRHFGAHRKTIALDLPGHGNSNTEAIPVLDDFINAIEDVCEGEGITSFVLIGHSMGGGVCLEAYRRRLRGLAGMVLVSTSPVLPVSPELVDIIKRDDMDALAHLIVGAVFSKKVDLLIGFAKKGLYEMNRAIIRRDVEICGEMDYKGMLADIDIPVLAIANRGDLVISSELTASFGNSIPGAKMVIFDDNGHVPFFENAHGFNDAVDPFLNEIDTSLINKGNT
jgi:pimeloyl-ACP methyl ester carboxylesterase